MSPADVAALYAAVAPGRRSLRMSSAELAAEPARRALEGGGDGVRSMRSWVVASLSAPGGEDVGLIQAFDKREGEFTHLDEEVLVQLAQMAAAAVERAAAVRPSATCVALRSAGPRSRCQQLLTPVGTRALRGKARRNVEQREPPGRESAEQHARPVVGTFGDATTRDSTPGSVI